MAVAGITAIVLLVPSVERELKTFDLASHAASSTPYQAKDVKSLQGALQKHQAAVRAFDKLSIKAKEERSTQAAVHRGMVLHLKDLIAAAERADRFAAQASELAKELGTSDDFERDGEWLDRACALRSKGKSAELDAAIEAARARRDRHFYSSIQQDVEKLIKLKAFGQARHLLDRFLAHSRLSEERAKAQIRRDVLLAEAREAFRAAIRECRGLRKLGMSREEVLREFERRVKNNYDVVLPPAEIDEATKTLSIE